MATLRSPTGAIHRLAPRMLIGRAPTCALRLQEPLASAEHAALAWTGSAWSLRDLGSRNGTFVDGKKLGSGVTLILRPGAKLGFGAKDGWQLIDAGAPVAMAIELDTSVILSAANNLLVLPSEREPEVSIYPSAAGGWRLEHADGQVRDVEDQAVVRTRGGTYRLMLPIAPEATPRAESGMKLEHVGFRFAVSRNEELVDLSLLYEDEVMLLERRDHHYVLLTLARVRGEEHELPSSERGWVDREMLLKMLSMEANAVNVAVHRARQQLLTAGVEGAAGIVEVRSGARRFGTDRFQVVPL